MHLQTTIPRYGTVNIKSENDLSRFEIQFFDSAATEVVGNRGISHLTEHLMCKAFDDLLETFKENGIEYNAMTGNDKMLFYFSGLDEYLTPFKYDLLDRIMNYEILESDFDKEKEIIIQEYNLAFSDQGNAHYYNFHRKYFNDYNAIGERSDIEDITFEDFKIFQKERFSKINRVLNISKYNDFELPAKYEYRLEENVVDLSYDVDKCEGIIEPTAFHKDTVSMINMSELIAYDDKENAKLDILCKFYSNGLSSPLYKVIREEKGYVYGLMFDVTAISANKYSLIFMTTTTEENVEDLNNTFFDIISDPSFITQDKLDQIIKQFTIKEKMVEISSNGKGNIFEEGKEDRNVYIAKDEVTLEELKELQKKYFKKELFTISTDRSI